VALYRVAQEALNNVLKHSGASDAAVSLKCQSDCALLSITDNGAGFNPEIVSPKHLGLRIMQERAAGVGATVKVISSEGHGTEVTVAWPDTSRREGA
jgi:signal transduction histidine kinase